MCWLFAVLKLLRADGIAAACMAIVLPFYVRTADLSLSTQRALPMLFIGGCTYIANDLDDIDKDRINHPRRPLASGRLTPTFATGLFFCFLAGALFSTRYFVPSNIAFYYYAAMIVAISYGYLVEWLPSLKTIYVSIAETIPLLILLSSFPGDVRLQAVTSAIFLHALGREICKDILDRPGDGMSFVRGLNPSTLAVCAFILQGAALSILALHSRTGVDFLVLLAMGGVVALAVLTWSSSASRGQSLILLKIELFLGLYFLL